MQPNKTLSVKSSGTPTKAASAVSAKPSGTPTKAASARSVNSSGTPKKAASAESAKPSITPKEAASGKPTFPSTLLASKLFMAFFVLLTVLLLFIAFALGFLYHSEYDKSARFFQAVSRIRRTMIILNANNCGLTDLEIILEAKKQSERLMKLLERNEDIIRKTEEIKALLKEQGWEASKGNIYYHSNEESDFNVAKDTCNRHKSMLVAIQTRDEQMRVMNIVKVYSKSFWIGLRKMKHNWRWSSGLVLTLPTYWGTGEPRNLSSLPFCVEARHNCSQQFRCWYVINCDERRGRICKRTPDPALIN